MANSDLALSEVEAAVAARLSTLSTVLLAMGDRFLVPAERQMETVMETLDQLDGWMSSLEDHVEALVSHGFENVMEDIATSLGNRFEMLDGLAESHIALLEEPLRDQALQSASLLEDRIRDVADAMETKREEVLEAFEEWKGGIEDAREKVMEDVENAVEHFKTMGDALMGRYDDLLEEISRFEALSKECEERLTEESGAKNLQLCKELAEMLTQQLTQAFHGSGREAIEALRRAKQLSEEKVEWLEEGIGKVTSRLDELLRIFEQIRPAIEAVRTVL